MLRWARASLILLSDDEDDLELEQRKVFKLKCPKLDPAK